MKQILLTLLFSFSLLYSNSLQLNSSDIQILKKIKSLTDDKMMKYSLMAIAIKESSLGKYVINAKSEDYGLFQANIKTVLSRQKVKDNSYNRSIYAQKLINDVITQGSKVSGNVVGNVSGNQTTQERNYLNGLLDFASQMTQNVIAP